MPFQMTQVLWEGGEDRRGELDRILRDSHLKSVWVGEGREGGQGEEEEAAWRRSSLVRQIASFALSPRLVHQAVEATPPTVGAPSTSEQAAPMQSPGRKERGEAAVQTEARARKKKSFAVQTDKVTSSESSGSKEVHSSTNSTNATVTSSSVWSADNDHSSLWSLGEVSFFV